MVNQDGCELTKAWNSSDSLHLSTKNLESLFIGLVLAMHEQMDRLKRLINKLN